MGQGYYNPDQFRGKSLRLSNHDYRGKNAYYITIRAYHHEPVFNLPPLRKIIVEIWKALPARFAGVTLDEFIMMPDHIHFIIWLSGSGENAPILGNVIGAYKSLTTVAWYRFLKTQGKT